MATQNFQDRTGKMAELCRRIVRINVRWNLAEKARVIRWFFRFVLDRVLVCSTRMPNSCYRRLSNAGRMNSSSPAPLEDMEFEIRDDGEEHAETTSSGWGYESNSDLVSLKISVLGDCQIGKTTFVIKYVRGGGRGCHCYSRDLTIAEGCENPHRIAHLAYSSAFSLYHN